MQNLIKRSLAMILSVVLLSTLLLSVSATATQQTLSAEEIIKQTAEEIASRLPQTDSVAEGGEGSGTQFKKNAVASGKKAGSSKTIPEEAYESADSIFEQIEQLESAQAKKDLSEAALTDAAQELVMASESYLPDSLERKGNSFTWWTTDGIRCVYAPRMREITANMEAPETPVEDGVYNEPQSLKNGYPSGKDVFLVGPYYGYDSDFTDEYRQQAARIAESIGDTDGYTLYSGTAATVDRVANAVSYGAVVIFDSHGMTDYENGYDYVTGANNSYLCLTSTSGLTSADYSDGALYYSDGIWINGETISNHMTKNSPSGILWMAICLGMATDTICEPLRQRGVEVVYGYSQSVTFSGDYLFADAFWDEMCNGADVASAIATMKSKWGNWDWSVKIAQYYGYNDGYATISQVRNDYFAFPVVVSDEDPHPGQRSYYSYGADSLQTVLSTYKLFAPGTQVDVNAIFAPIVTDYTDEMIEVYAVDGFEYSINGVSWQSANRFTSLNPSTQYKVYQRRKATGSSPAGATSPATTVTTAAKGTDFNSFYSEIAEYVVNNGFIDSNGYPFLKHEFSLSGVDFELYLSYYYDSISLELWSSSVSDNVEIISYIYLYIYPDDVQCYVPMDVYLYINDTYIETVSGGQYINRTTLSADNDYYPYAYGTYITSSNYQSLYNSMLDVMCYMGDMDIADLFGNGLKGLGFRSFVSEYGYHVCDAVTNYHIGKTESRNARTGYCMIPGYSGDQYCLGCGDKLVKGQQTGTTSNHIFAASGTTNCVLCGAEGSGIIDLDGDMQLTDADAIYLLRHTLFAHLYPININGDMNSDGTITDADAIYLLRHTLFPSIYPLYP